MKRAWMQTLDGWVSREATPTDLRTFEIMAQWGEPDENNRPISLHKCVEALTEAGLWNPEEGYEPRHKAAEPWRDLWLGKIDSNEARKRAFGK